MSDEPTTYARSPLAGEPNRPPRFGGGTERARQLRKNATIWERKLWRLLKCKQLEMYKFRRQAPIDHYIVDFVNYEKRLVIELDGSQHAGSAHDKTRDAHLMAQGFTVLRFWNNELDANPTGVIERILDVLNHIPPPKS